MGRAARINDESGQQTAQFLRPAFRPGGQKTSRAIPLTQAHGVTEMRAPSPRGQLLQTAVEVHAHNPQPRGLLPGGAEGALVDVAKLILQLCLRGIVFSMRKREETVPARNVEGTRAAIQLMRKEAHPKRSRIFPSCSC